MIGASRRPRGFNVRTRRRMYRVWVPRSRLRLGVDRIRDRTVNVSLGFLIVQRLG